jgi:hypothetical protein
MKKDIVDYIVRCMERQRVKAEHRHPTGLLQPLSIPEKKWEVVTIDFIIKLPRTARQHDSIMVVVDKMTKAALLGMCYILCMCVCERVRYDNCV